MTNDDLYNLLRYFRKQLVDAGASQSVIMEYSLMMTRLMNKVCGVVHKESAD